MAMELCPQKDEKNVTCTEENKPVIKPPKITSSMKHSIVLVHKPKEHNKNQNAEKKSCIAVGTNNGINNTEVAALVCNETFKVATKIIGTQTPATPSIYKNEEDYKDKRKVENDIYGGNIKQKARKVTHSRITQEKSITEAK